MDQFSAARARAEKRLERLQRTTGNQSGDMGKRFLVPEKHLPVLHLPKPPKTNGRHNEVDVTIHVNGKSYSSSFKTDIVGSTMLSSLNDDGLKTIVAEMLSTKFGRTKPL